MEYDTQGQPKTDHTYGLGLIRSNPIDLYLPNLDLETEQLSGVEPPK
jgi:hypothetical protein